MRKLNHQKGIDVPRKDKFTSRSWENSSSVNLVDCNYSFTTAEQQSNAVDHKLVARYIPWLAICNSCVHVTSDLTKWRTGHE
jgi:hypothetical protein